MTRRKLWKTADVKRDQWEEQPISKQRLCRLLCSLQRVDDAEKPFSLISWQPQPAKRCGHHVEAFGCRCFSEEKFDEVIGLVDTMPDDPQLRLKKIDLVRSIKGIRLMPSAHHDRDAEKNKTPELTLRRWRTSISIWNRVQQSLDLLNQVLAERPGMPNARSSTQWRRSGLPNPKLDDAISDLVQVREDMPQNLAARYLLVGLPGTHQGSGHKRPKELRAF